MIYIHNMVKRPFHPSKMLKILKYDNDSCFFLFEARPDPILGSGLTQSPHH